MFLDSSFDERLADLVVQFRIAWVAAIVLLALLVLFMLRARGMSSSNRAPAKTVESLVRCDSATASIEFLLVLFPFLFIVMTVWQLAFMFNARLHVGYAAFAAARSAAVVIPAEIDQEKEGELKKDGNGVKWRKIRRAAIPGTLAISPGDPEAAAGTVALALGGPNGAPRFDGAALVSRMLTMGAHYLDPSVVLRGTRARRAAVKSAYADQMTQVLVNGQDQRSDQNLAQNDTVSVTVNYVFPLQVPYVGRMLEAVFKNRINPITDEPLFTTPYPSMQMTETIAMPLWRRKRAIEPGSS
jgi:hypothetical protein